MEPAGPRFSVVVPLHDGGPYVEGCLQSILGQQLAGSDLELVVVDDASTDDSAVRAQAVCDADPRARLLRHAQNGGTLRARRDGVLATRGEYVLLVDQDDELAPGALARVDEALRAHPVDILHFGVRVVAESPAAEGAAAGMQGFLTPPPRELQGPQILAQQFAETDGFDWNVHHKALRGELARAAWGELEDVELVLSDDLYACFALCARATSYLALADAPWYEYHLGRGDTLGKKLTLGSFRTLADRDRRALEIVEAYVARVRGELARDDWGARVADVCDRLASHAASELHDNLAGDDLDLGVAHLVATWPAPTVAGQLFRLVRDEAFAVWDAGGTIDGTERWVGWYWLAEELAASPSAPLTGRLGELEAGARDHLRNLEMRSGPVACDAARVRPAASAAYGRHPVRIFVTTHKDVDVFWSEVLQPVQVGPVEGRPRLLWALQDDTGDSLAELNPMYCELTTQYWAWRNVALAPDAPEYLGFCHYRRYFDLSGEKHPENVWGEVEDGPVCWGTQALYGLDDTTIEAAVAGWDVVVTRAHDLRDFPGGFQTPREHYAAAPYLDVADLDRAMALVCELHPDCAEDVRAYLEGSVSSFCNMFVMRRGLLCRYCEWLFPVLGRFVEGWDTAHASHERLRTPGHLAERLLNVFLLHERRLDPDLRVKEVPCVRFGRPERLREPCLPALDPEGAPVVPVVLAASDGYAPMLLATVASMLEHASPAFRYDVVVLSGDFSARNQRVVRDHVAARWPHARVRFADVRAFVADRGLATSNEHISVETYYRFLIQRVLPDYDRVLYLDSDLVVLGDVAELWATDLEGCLVGAVTDIDYLGNLNMPDGERLAYSREVLGLADPYGYFQAGVLLLDTAGLRALHTVEEWLALAARDCYIYDDQDILNAECQGRVRYLDPSWNVMHDCDGRVEKVFSFAPAEVYDRYREAYAAPRIVHYAGYEKPWKPGPCDERGLWWSYARRTPLYEEALALLAAQAAPPPAPEPEAPQHERAVSEESGLRRVLDPLLPLGSRRREWAKALGRALRGRS